MSSDVVIKVSLFQVEVSHCCMCLAVQTLLCLKALLVINLPISIQYIHLAFVQISLIHVETKGSCGEDVC